MELNKVLEGFTVSNTLVIKAQVQVIRCVMCYDGHITASSSTRRSHLWGLSAKHRPIIYSPVLEIIERRFVMDPRPLISPRPV